VPQAGLCQNSTLGKPEVIAAWLMYVTKGAYNEQWISSPHDLSGECWSSNPLFRGRSTSTRGSAQKLTQEMASTKRSAKESYPGAAQHPDDVNSAAE
jgi:hypothetical protein